MFKNVLLYFYLEDLENNEADEPTFLLNAGTHSAFTTGTHRDFITMTMSQIASRENVLINCRLFYHVFKILRIWQYNVKFFFVCKCKERNQTTLWLFFSTVTSWILNAIKKTKTSYFSTKVRKNNLFSFFVVLLTVSFKTLQMIPCLHKIFF